MKKWALKNRQRIRPGLGTPRSCVCTGSWSVVMPKAKPIANAAFNLRGGVFKFATHGDQAPKTPHLLHVAVDRCWGPCRGFRWAGATGSQALLSAPCAGAYRMRTAVVEQRLSSPDFTQSSAAWRGLVNSSPAKLGSEPKFSRPLADPAGAALCLQKNCDLTPISPTVLVC